MITLRMPGIAVSMESLMVMTLAFILCLGDSVMATTTTLAPANTTTPKPSWSLNLTHEASTTSSITVRFDYPAIYIDSIEEYMVHTTKEGSDSVLHSPTIQGNETTYEVENLLTNSLYRICVYVTFKQGQEQQGDTEDCEEFKTLALIRKDSLIAILVALGLIVLLILIGIICWQCAKHRMEKNAHDDSTDEHEELLEKQDNPGGHLLAPPPQGRPRSSIEEEMPFIPYITPPIEELEREKRAAATNNV